MRNQCHSQEDAELMDEVHDLEARALALHRKVGTRLVEQEQDAVIAQNAEGRARLTRSEAWRWHGIAKTDIQTGFMALVRSIAQPMPKE